MFHLKYYLPVANEIIPNPNRIDGVKHTTIPNKNTYLISVIDCISI